MPRIALVASSFLPRVGGVEEHVANVALQLRDLGHEVSIWATDQGDRVPANFHGVPLRYLPCPMPARSVGATTRFLGAGVHAWRSWRGAMRQDRPDILHVHCFGPNGVYATALSRASRRPLVLSHHGETFGDANRVFDHSALLRRALGASLSHAAAVTSCSRFAAEDLARFGTDPDAVEVVFNGIDLDEPCDGRVDGLPARYVLGVGRLVANKGFDSLVRAFSLAAVGPALAGVDLVIGGDGPERAALAALAGSLGVGDRVHLIGRLDRPQVGAVMAGAELLVVPSRLEGFGITILEGWRAGIPVIATERGGPPEFVEHDETGLLFDPEDVEALSAHLTELMGDAERRACIGAAGRAAADGFTWRRVAEQYDALYSRVVGRT